jgi:hypothetical protein
MYPWNHEVIDLNRVNVDGPRPDRIKADQLRKHLIVCKRQLSASMRLTQTQREVRQQHIDLVEEKLNKLLPFANPWW